MRKKNDVREFHFQVMSFEDAKNLVLAGDGKYADLKAGLLAQIPTLEPDQAFSFGTNGDTPLSDGERHSMVNSLNKTLKKSGLSWWVSYSRVKKLFIVTPRELLNYEKKPRKSSELSTRQEPKSSKISIREFMLHAQRCFGGADAMFFAKDRAIRTAVSVVGYLDWKFRTAELAKAIHLSTGGVLFNMNRYRKNELAKYSLASVTKLRSYMKNAVSS